MFPAQSSALEVVVDQSFNGIRFDWDRTGDMLIRYRPVIHEGELHVCGAYSNRGGRTFVRLGREVMRQASASVSGSTVVRNLSFFNVVSNANNSNGLEGQVANCVNTGRAATAAELGTFELNVRDGKYRVR